MKFAFKSLLYTALGATLTFSQGCNVFKASKNPALQKMASTNQSDLLVRANCIAEQEQSNPKGFRVSNKDFAASNGRFVDAFNTGITRKYIQTELGFDFKNEAVFAKSKDGTQPYGNCDREVTRFVGHPKDLPYHVQMMYEHAKQAANDSKNNKSAMKEAQYLILDSARVIRRQDLGSFFISSAEIDLKNKTISYLSCGVSNDMTATDKKVEFAYNKEWVADAQQFLKNKEYKTTRRYETLNK